MVHNIEVRYRPCDGLSLAELFKVLVLGHETVDVICVDMTTRGMSTSIKGSSSGCRVAAPSIAVKLCRGMTVDKLFHRYLCLLAVDRKPTPRRLAARGAAHPLVHRAHGDGDQAVDVNRTRLANADLPLDALMPR